MFSVTLDACVFQTTVNWACGWTRFCAESQYIKMLVELIDFHRQGNKFKILNVNEKSMVFKDA